MERCQIGTMRQETTLITHLTIKIVINCTQKSRETKIFFINILFIKSQSILNINGFGYNSKIICVNY